MNEIWKPIPGYQNYLASSNGNIMRDISPGRRTKKILKQYKDRKGYMYVCLSVSGIVKTCRVHRLVCLAFFGKLNNLTVNHINLIKTDNNIENLELLSMKENLDHAIENGHFSISGAKISYEDACCIRNMKVNGISTADISKKYDITTRTVNRILKNQSWTTQPKTS